MFLNEKKSHQFYQKKRTSLDVATFRLRFVYAPRHLPPVHKDYIHEW